MKKIKGFICRTNKKPFSIEMHDHTIIDKLLIESSFFSIILLEKNNKLFRDIERRNYSLYVN